MRGGSEVIRSLLPAYLSTVGTDKQMLQGGRAPCRRYHDSETASEVSGLILAQPSETEQLELLSHCACRHRGCMYVCVCLCVFVTVVVDTLSATAAQSTQHLELLLQEKKKRTLRPHSYPDNTTTPHARLSSSRSLSAIVKNNKKGNKRQTSNPAPWNRNSRLRRAP